MALQEREAVPRPLTVSESLILARESAEVFDEVLATLEGALQHVSRRIEAQPETYIMSVEEYSVLNYFQDRWKHNRLFGQAIFRFWKKLTARPKAATVTVMSSKAVAEEVPDIPPSGYSGPDSISKALQNSLQDFCDSQVTVGDQEFAARYWYDVKYATTAKEDAADEALRRFKRNLTASALHQHALQANKKNSSMQHTLKGRGQVQSKQGAADIASNNSEVNSVEDDTFEFESPGHLKTFFDPKTGAKSILTPCTSVYSDGGDTKSENMYPSDEEAARKVVIVSQRCRDVFPNETQTKTIEQERKYQLQNVQ
ncbi:MAG: hypothetical protein Q9164_006452 [Protoblastenia rupestris]